MQPLLHPLRLALLALLCTSSLLCPSLVLGQWSAASEESCSVLPFPGYPSPPVDGYYYELGVDGFAWQAMSVSSPSSSAVNLTALSISWYASSTASLSGYAAFRMAVYSSTGSLLAQSALTTFRTLAYDYVQDVLLTTPYTLQAGSTQTLYAALWYNESIPVLANTSTGTQLRIAYPAWTGVTSMPATLPTFTWTAQFWLSMAMVTCPAQLPSASSQCPAAQRPVVYPDDGYQHVQSNSSVLSGWLGSPLLSWQAVVVQPTSSSVSLTGLSVFFYSLALGGDLRLGLYDSSGHLLAQSPSVAYLQAGQSYPPQASNFTFTVPVLLAASSAARTYSMAVWTDTPLGVYDWAESNVTILSAWLDYDVTVGLPTTLPTPNAPGVAGSFAVALLACEANIISSSGVAMPTATAALWTTPTASAWSVGSSSSAGSSSVPGSPLCAASTHALLSAQRAALIDLYCQCGGSGWAQLGVPIVWDPALHECEWRGLACDDSGRVTSIQLNSTGLTGQLPSSLSALSQLTDFEVMFNALTGSIPHSYASWTLLDIFLVRANNLSGAFPNWPLCNLSSVWWIDTSSNRFTGALNECLGDLPRIEVLYVSYNDQLGPAVPELKHAVDTLSVVDLSGNAFQGAFPSSWAAMSSLTVLFSHDNQLSGALPLSLLQLPNLELVNLNNNLFTSFDCSLFLNGSATSTSKVGSLFLSGNQLASGMVDLLVCLATVTPNTVWLDVSNNSLYWDDMPFPPGFPSNYFPYIYQLSLANNSIEGPIDYFLEQMFWLGQVFDLDLSYNRFTGTIPVIADQFLKLEFTGNSNLSAAVAVNATGAGLDAQLQQPMWVQQDTATQLRDDTRNCTCPQLDGQSPLVLALDPSYLVWQHCSCFDGYARKADESVCSPCPEHVQCSPSMLQPQHSVQAGYYPWPLPAAHYRANSLLLLTSSTFEACKPPGVCVSSPDSNGVMPAFGCLPGHDENALLCSRCLDRYFMYQGVCHECGGYTRGSAIATVVIGLLIIVLLVFLFVFFEKPDAVDGTAAAASPPPSQQLLLERVAFVEILIFFFQASSVLEDLATSSTSTDNGATDTDDVDNSISMLGRVLRFSPVAYDCAFDWLDWRAFFWILLTAPGWLLAVVLVGWALARFNPFRRIDVSYITAASCRVAAFLLSLVYMQVTIFIFQAWRCNDIQFGSQSDSYLVAAPYLSCHSSEYPAIKAASIVAFVLFTLSFPLWTLFYSYCEVVAANAVNQRTQRPASLKEKMSRRAAAEHGAQGQLNERSCSRPWHALRETGAMMNCVLMEAATAKTLPRCWSWQVVAQFRKLLLTAVIYLVSSNNQTGMVIAVIAILVLLIICSAWVRPYVRHLDSASEVLLLFLLLLSFVVQLTLGAAKLSVASSAALDASVLRRAANTLTILQWAAVISLLAVQVWHLRSTLWEKARKICAAVHSSCLCYCCRSCCCAAADDHSAEQEAQPSPSRWRRSLHPMQSLLDWHVTPYSWVCEYCEKTVRGWSFVQGLVDDTDAGAGAVHPGTVVTRRSVNGGRGGLHAQPPPPPQPDATAVTDPYLDDSSQVSASSHLSGSSHQLAVSVSTGNSNLAHTHLVEQTEHQLQQRQQPHEVELQSQQLQQHPLQRTAQHECKDPWADDHYPDQY